MNGVEPKNVESSELIGSTRRQYALQENKIANSNLTYTLSGIVKTLPFLHSSYNASCFSLSLVQSDFSS